MMKSECAYIASQPYPARDIILIAYQALLVASGIAVRGSWDELNFYILFESSSPLINVGRDNMTMHTRSVSAGHQNVAEEGRTRVHVAG
jgi:hypothetical protein